MDPYLSQISCKNFHVLNLPWDFYRKDPFKVHLQRKILHKMMVQIYIQFIYKFIYNTLAQPRDYSATAMLLFILKWNSRFFYHSCSLNVLVIIFTVYNSNRSSFSIYCICMYISRWILTESLCFLLGKIILYFPEKHICSVDFLNVL